MGDYGLNKKFLLGQQSCKDFVVLLYAGVIHNDLSVVVESEGAHSTHRFFLFEVLLLYFLLVITF